MEGKWSHKRPPGLKHLSTYSRLIQITQTIKEKATAAAGQNPIRKGLLAFILLTLQDNRTNVNEDMRARNRWLDRRRCR